MLSIRTLLKSQFLAFILAMMLVPVLLVLSQRLIGELIDSSKWVEHTYNVLTHIERLNNNTEVIESARRGFAMSREEQYLRPYYYALQDTHEELSTLQKLTIDNQDQQQRLKQISPVVQSLVSLATKQIETSSRNNAGQPAETMQQAKLLIDQFRELIGQMREAESKLLTPRAAMTEQDINQIKLMMLAMVAAFVMLLFFSFFGMFREIRQRAYAEQALVKSQARNELTVGNLSLMAEMTSLLQACTDTEESLRVVQQFSSKLLDVDTGVLYLFRESRNQVEASASWGNPSNSQPIFQPNDCWGLRRGESHIFDHSRHTLACKHLTYVGISSLCIPIVAQGNVLGILYLENQAGKDINELDRGLTKNLASQIALALASIKLRETLRNLSVRDPLTGLFNRRYMEESLQREIATAQRKKRSLGVVIFDLDHFKNFNDTFGHEAGDLLLREVGTLMTKSSRAGDIACRFGGEEFVMIYPEAEAETVINLSNALREEIFDMQLQHFGRSLGQISASFGLAFYPGHGESGEALLRLADQALYRAKATGRNRLEVAITDSAMSLSR